MRDHVFIKLLCLVTLWLLQSDKHRESSCDPWLASLGLGFRKNLNTVLHARFSSTNILFRTKKLKRKHTDLTDTGVNISIFLGDRHPE